MRIQSLIIFLILPVFTVAIFSLSYTISSFAEAENNVITERPSDKKNSDILCDVKPETVELHSVHSSVTITTEIVQRRAGLVFVTVAGPSGAPNKIENETDTTGLAIFKYKVGLEEGHYQVQASWNGDEEYRGATSDTCTFRVIFKEWWQKPASWPNKILSIFNISSTSLSVAGGGYMLKRMLYSHGTQQQERCWKINSVIMGVGMLVYWPIYLLIFQIN